TGMSVRFVKAQREMEGRYEDVWVLVDEADDLETWNDESELDIVGNPGTRLDGHARASGRARYTVDIRPPGTLETAVLRSPVAHGRVSGIDLEAARALPGVRAVLGPGSELGLSTREPLLAEEPVFAGQPVAVVAADTKLHAFEALAALALEL